MSSIYQSIFLANKYPKYAVAHAQNVNWESYIALWTWQSLSAFHLKSIDKQRSEAVAIIWVFVKGSEGMCTLSSRLPNPKRKILNPNPQTQP